MSVSVRLVAVYVFIFLSVVRCVCVYGCMCPSVTKWDMHVCARLSSVCVRYLCLCVCLCVFCACVRVCVCLR